MLQNSISKCKPRWAVCASRARIELLIIFLMLSTGYWGVKLWIVAGLESIPRDTLPLQIPPKHSHRQLPCSALMLIPRNLTSSVSSLRSLNTSVTVAITPVPERLEPHSVLPNISNSYHRSNLFRAMSSQMLEIKEQIQLMYAKTPKTGSSQMCPAEHHHV